MDVSWIERKMYRVASSLFFVRFHRRVFFALLSLSLSPSPTHTHTYTKRNSAFSVVTTIITVSFSIISLPLERRTETKEKVLPSIALFLFPSFFLLCC